MKSYNLSEEEVKEIIESPFIFIRKTLKNLEFEGTETKEEFDNKVKNFNIPCIGKLYGNYYNFKRINNNELTRGRQQSQHGEEN